MADETKTGELLERAREWLDMVQPKWRLQTMQHRSRRNRATGEDVRLPTRVRRFLNGTPVGMKDAVLALLAESAPYTSPVFDCEETDGLPYRPVNTFIRKDGPEFATGGRDPTYTIIQDLLLDDGQDDALGVRSESSCSRLSETEYVWDAAEVADAEVGGQGVSYEVVNVSRDRETDLFSYQLRRVVALTPPSSVQVVECDSRHTVTEETWDNLYGGPGAFRKDGEASHGAGAAVAIPEPCSSPDGTTVVVDVKQNADCTYRVTVRTSVAHGDERGHGSSETAFEKNEWEASANQASALPDAPAASGGVVVKRESEKNPDDTWNNREDTTTEKESTGARVVKRKTLRGITTSTTDRNTTNSDATVTNVGDQVEVEKTPGGLYNRTVTTVDKTPVGTISESCSATPAVHTDTKTSNVPDGQQPDPKHQTATVNVEKTVEARRTDEGTWDVTERTSTHTPFGPQPIATVSGGQKITTIEMFQNAPTAPNRTEGVNKDVDVSVSRNQVGSFDGRVVTNEFMPREYPLASIEAEMKTVKIDGFVNKEEPPETQLTGPNVEASVSAHLNGHGTFDGTIHKETFKPKEYDLGTVSSNARDITISGFYNQEKPPVQDAGTNESLSISAHVNGHGTFDGTVHKETFHEISATSTTKWGLETATTTVTRHGTGMSAQPDGDFGEASADPDDNGGCTMRVTEYTPHKVDTEWLEYDSTEGGRKYNCGVRAIRNLDALPEFGTRGSDGHRSLSVSINRYGLFDVVMSYKAPADDGSGDEQSNFTKTVDIDEEEVVSTQKSASSLETVVRVNHYRKTMRYDTNSGWWSSAAADIREYPGVGRHVSRITGTHMWEYWQKRKDPEIKMKTISTTGGQGT